MTDDRQKNSKVLEIFQEWSQNISIHGFPNIFRKNITSVRIMWVILFLVSNGICFGIISSIVINYLKYDVVTKIRIADKDSLPFPSITVCNVNSFVSEQSLEYAQYLLEKNKLVNFTDSMIIDQIFPYNFSKLYFSYNIVRLLATVQLKSSSSELKQKLLTPLDNIIISCLYNAQPCDKNDWTLFIDPQFGFCYQFNTDKEKIKRSFQTGKYNGLMLELYVGLPDHKDTLSISTGAHVFINDNSIKPLIGQGLSIAPGTYSNLVLGRTTNKQMPQPYSECQSNLDSIDSFDSEYYRKVFKSNLTYRQIDCFYAYILSETYKKCHCDDPISNLINENDNPCDTLEEQLCAVQNYRMITSSDYKKKVSKLCPLECESVSFSVIKSEGKYPSPSYAREMAKTEKIRQLFNNRSDISLQEFREKTLAVNIFYEYLRETQITESATITWDGLIGSIGGTLGLFLGISILSLVEFIDLIFRMICNKN